MNAAPSGYAPPLFALAPGIRLVLASASPRRRAFLAQWGIPCELRTAEHNEPRPQPGEVPAAYACRAAVAKARAVAHAERSHGARGGLVLAADTVVAVDDDILGKPRNREDSLRMLRRLAGRAHTVVSAVCLLGPLGIPQDQPDCRPAWAAADQEDVFSDASTVVFHAWPEPVLAAYAHCGEGDDKAGAYAIQGRGAFLVERVEGSWSTVVGLPVTMLARRLLARGLMRAAPG